MVRAVQVAAAAVLLATLTAGCGDDELASDHPTEVSLSATATRSSLFDSQRTFRIELTNDGDAPVTVETLALRSPLFADEPASPRDTQLAPGQRLLVPVPYGDAVCPPADEANLLVASVAGEDVEVPLAQDPDAVMDDLNALECDQQAVRDAVDLAFGDDWTPTGPRSASGFVDVTPHDGAPAATLDELRGNIVFGVRLDDGVLPTTSRFPVEMVVDRCDTHALIESKRTFKFPIAVTLGDGEPIVYVIEAVAGTPARAVFADLIQACIG